jgi:hypothetical protein
MNTNCFRSWLCPAIWLCVCANPALAREPLALRAQASGPQLELSWPGTLPTPAGVKAAATYQIQASADLRNWVNVGERIASGAQAAAERLKTIVTPPGQPMFYRVVASVDPASITVDKAGGEEVFGYAAEFAKALKAIGQISPQDLAARYPAPTDYLPGISWDPTTAQYWDLFNASENFRLNADELAIFKKNGFVVSERLGSPTFADSFYRIFSGDLPVFVSSDAILHAWHRTYDAMLEELEEVYLTDSLDKLLAGLAAQIPETWSRYGQGVLRNCILDADYFLAVARSLLAERQVSTYLNQNTRVATTLDAVVRQTLETFDLFGKPRQVDFSQFKVRGHYENSERLKRYFRAMMWCGRIDLRMAGNPRESSARELGTALVLTHLLNQAAQFDRWSQFDRIIQVFVGWTDSMTFAQLGDLLKAANIGSLADVRDLAALEKLQWAITTGGLGFQQIRSDYYESPFTAEQIQLPCSFTVLGQKFVLDSWAFSQMVFDSIIWDEDGAPDFGDKVQRRIPSCLDVAFAVLGNNQAVPELVARITNPNGRKFRDGLPYQHNMAAMRQVIDSQNASIWNENIYLAWLAALRELSVPTTSAKYPEAMRTRAWAMKTLNTQLASWAQLRHDTILYAKQSYTGGIICSYPAGFVEPYPEFWGRLTALATRAADLINGIPFQGSLVVKGRVKPGETPPDIPVDLAWLKRNQVSFLRQFADQVARLRTIAEKELAQTPLSQAETDFLKDLIELHRDPYYGTKRYTGWYPRLFYLTVFQNDPMLEHQGSDQWDAIVADVHTDVPAPIIGDSGCVLHQGIGNVHLMIIAIDNGTDHMAYAGPVLSHYEFEMPGVTRKSDSEWKADLKAGKLPPHPEWTRSYLVPGPYTVPPGYE